MSHANALLTPRGRLQLARCLVEDGWPLRRAAERFQALGEAVVELRVWKKSAEGRLGPSRTSR